MLNQKNSTLNEIMFAAKPTVWVYAQGELSRMISFTCQNNRTEERMYPIKPIIQVKAVASIINAYCDRTEIFPHSIAPICLAPFIIKPLSANMKKMQESGVANGGTDRRNSTFTGMQS